MERHESHQGEYSTQWSIKRKTITKLFDRFMNRVGHIVIGSR